MRLPLRAAISVTSLLVLVAADTIMLRAASSQRSYAVELYEEGEASPQDAQQTRESLEKAAAAGNAGAMYMLGEMYYSGQGVPQNYQKAREWYEKAAAHYHLGRILKDTGQEQAAADQFAAACAVEPQNPQVCRK